MAEYFFELLTEEIPAWMHVTASATLRDKLTDFCATVAGSANEKSVTVHSSSRRIAFVLHDLPARTEDQKRTVKGPPKSAAYKDDKPTPALLGFLKKQNAQLEDLVDDDPQYIVINTTVPGLSTREILAKAIPDIVGSLRWPKMMRWGGGEYSYIRPIHSLVSIFDGEHLPIAIFNKTSGTSTVGHRTLAPQRFDVSSYEDYVRKLELARVVIEPERRRAVMAQRALLLAKEIGGTPAEDASIWSQWQYLTEYPGLVRAEFRKESLVLPEEVLVTVMRVHQKQLPIRARDGRLSNSFLAVLDNEGDPEGNAAYGNSFVTNARFADAQFFYETDRKRPLADRAEQLTHLQFHEKLGDYLAKSKRIRAIVEKLGGDAEALQAAELCKCDLVTEMVKEFTELQGKVGGIYAREEGLAEDVWTAIYDHYLPANLDDPLPRTRSGALVSIADRIDTLVGFFRVGIRPTGSKDPFALRRAAQGIVQILLNRDKREVKVGIDELLAAAFDAHGIAPTVPISSSTPTLKEELLIFIGERVRTILEASAWKFSYDEITAAMRAGWTSSLTDLVDRIQALHDVRNTADFLSLLDSARRIANIIEGQATMGIDPSRFEHPTERRLSELIDVVKEQIDELVAGRQYRAALESFAAMAPELERFFQDVMVMVDDAYVRDNRIALLTKVGNAVGRIADLKAIVVDRRDYRS